MEHNIDTVRDLLKDLTSEERLSLFTDYCRHCGDKNPKCNCWRDE